MNFQKLIEIREDFNLKQKDIASVLGITQQSYSLWENGSKIIPLKHLNNLCNYYNLSMDYVIGITRTSKSTKKYKFSNEIIGQRLKEFRKSNEITQTELANILNTTQSTISAYESGKTTLLTAFALEIVNKCNISLDWLCGRK